MFETIREFTEWLGVSPWVMEPIINSLVALGVIKIIYPWTPEYKAKTTKDKDGNVETTFYKRNK